MAWAVVRGSLHACFEALMRWRGGTLFFMTTRLNGICKALDSRRYAGGTRPRRSR
jgi:hypothetical protein